MQAFGNRKRIFSAVASPRVRSSLGNALTTYTMDTASAAFGGGCGVQILEQHMARVDFLIAKNAHQQLRGQIIGHRPQTHAHDDRTGGHLERSLPASAGDLALLTQLSAGA